MDKLKKTIIVSNNWRPEEDSKCGKCGEIITCSWGDYSFRYFEQRDKSDLCVICKSCAAEMTRNDKKIKVINRSPIMELINLKNSGWKTQPNRQGSGFSFGNGGRGEPDLADEKDTQE